jgi:hypothetical protein
MGAAEIFIHLGRLGLLVVGLLLPGAMVLRVLRLPWMLAASFVASAAILHACVVLFALLHVPVSLVTLATALGLVTLAFGAWARQRNSRFPPAESTAPFSFLLELGAWTPLYAVFWAVVLWRLATQPLNGGDVDFRWSWLAEQMLHLGSLDFYPPRSAADFTRYFWAESLPPGVAGLHAWAYACGASTRELWTSAGVGLQLLALYDLVWRLAYEWGGQTAARRAVLLAVATPILNWSVLMGQETGLTAVAVCALCFALGRWHQTRAIGWLALGALAALVGASTREYGLAFPLLGLGVLVLMHAPRRAVVIFAAIALPLAIVWPLRTWVLTGNPFYSLGFGGLFPVNPVFVAWSASISAGTKAAFAARAGWEEIAFSLVLCAPTAIFCWLALAVHAARGLREARWCALCVGVTAVLWFASVPYTGGGLFYSLRVLSPAFALGAAFGGYALYAAGRAPLHRGLMHGVLACLVLTTLPATLTLPQNPYRVSPHEWPGLGRQYVDISRHADAEVARFLQTQPGHTRILSECVSLPRSLAPAGITVIPMWSPEVAWLFDPTLKPIEVARHWRQSGLHYVVMTRAPAQLQLLLQHARWRAPFFAVKKIWESDAYVVFGVETAPLPKP